VLSWIANAWRVPELRRRLLFTAFVLALYRLGSFIPAPGVDSDQIKTYFGNQGGTVLGLLNLFSGNALSRFSIFALGIMPYITASIILQLGAVVVPTLAQLQKEGEAGYAKINQYTRYLTVCLAAAQAVGYSYLFRRQHILTANTGRLVLIAGLLAPLATPARLLAQSAGSAPAASQAQAAQAVQGQEKPSDTVPLIVHTGWGSLAKDTARDFWVFPQRKSTWVLLGAGALAALAVHPADDYVEDMLTALRA